MDSDNIFEGLKENKKTLIIAFVLIIVMIVISILNLVLGNNGGSVDMKGVITSFAEIYYEESYYPQIKLSHESDYYNELAKSEKEGIRLTLRKIVNTFEGIDTTKFYQDGNYCNFVETYAIIYPKSPYGIDDYKIEVNISCRKKMDAN